MEMDERLLRELASVLPELKEYLADRKTMGRPTEVIMPRAENVILKALAEQREKCTSAWEKEIGEKLGSLVDHIKKTEEQITQLNDRIFSEVKGVGEESKTTSQKVVTLNGRLGRIEDRLEAPEHEESYENRMGSAELWISEEEHRRAVEREESRRSLTTTIAVISVIAAILFGAGGLVIGILQLIG